jgi:GDP-D-mannose 3', 5'-epimerase
MKENSEVIDRKIGRDDLIVIAGAGGFIAGALTRYFHDLGYTRIRAIDRKPLPEWYQRVPGVECLSMDLSEKKNAIQAVEGAAEVYNLAADMGGMGFIEHFRVECLRSILINTHLIEAAWRAGAQRYFFSSSACAYNTDLQQDPNVRALKESDAYPAMAERGYGWEKLISEMFCQEYWAERGLETHIARFHNIYGPHGTWFGGREKAPAALSRKVIEAIDRGDHHRHLGRRFANPQLLLHRRLRAGHRPDHALRPPDCDAHQPRIERADLDQRSGSMVEEIAGVKLQPHLRSECSQRRRRAQQRQHVHQSVLDWEPHTPLRTGMEKTYAWIAQQYADRKAGKRVVKD